MKATNEITGITFIRRKEGGREKLEHEIILHLKTEIPALGYGPKEIRKMLKNYYKPNTQQVIKI